MAPSVPVGIVGCGEISSQYIRNMMAFEILEVVSVTDLDPGRAQAVAASFGLQATSLAEMLADPKIEIVVNLTTPAAHTELSLQTIKAGKHIYSEKPLAITRSDAAAILTAAKQQGLRVGAAPDSFLGGGLQTCRKLIDSGEIGQPVAAATFLATHGPEELHPNPAFYYQRGAGPMFDLGPYSLTALIALLGPVVRVAASARITSAQRQIHSQPRYGEVIPVEVPTHISGTIDFASGVVASVTNSFDIWASNRPPVEVYGSKGSLCMPGTNKFGGPVLVRQANARQWTEMALTHSAATGRGIGVADLAYAIRSGRPHRANGEMAYHILDLMHAFIESSEQARHIPIQSRCERPAPVPEGLPAYTLDE